MNGPDNSETVDEVCFEDVPSSGTDDEECDEEDDKENDEVSVDEDKEKEEE